MPASPTFSSNGIDDGSEDSEDYSIIVSLLVPRRTHPSSRLAPPLPSPPASQTEQDGLEASHGTMYLESSLPEDFLNLFSVI